MRYFKLYELQRFIEISDLLDTDFPLANNVLCTQKKGLNFVDFFLPNHVSIYVRQFFLFIQKFSQLSKYFFYPLCVFNINFEFMLNTTWVISFLDHSFFLIFTSPRSHLVNDIAFERSNIQKLKCNRLFNWNVDCCNFSCIQLSISILNLWKELLITKI